jgi:uncharacterized protein YndB with AHSA1/START domain
MATRPSLPAATLHLSRTIAAPREAVFRAWTSPEALKRWWGPPGYETPEVEVDLRVGGRYRLAMRKGPTGELFYLSGTYREVEPPARLVYSWRWESEAEEEETLVTVEFLARGPSTEVRLTHERFVTEEARDEHRRGWGGCLDRLAAAL